MVRGSSTVEAEIRATEVEVAEEAGDGTTAVDAVATFGENAAEEVGASEAEVAGRIEVVAEVEAEAEDHAAVAGVGTADEGGARRIRARLKVLTF